MKNSYTPEKGAYFSGYDDEKFNTAEGESFFHIGQSYEKNPAQRLTCKTCGGDKFEVGQGHCFTAIRCPTCKWETCIHEG